MDDGTVCGRMVAILDAVGALGTEATLAAVTLTTGIPKPTVRRIAAGLVARELLERTRAGYRLGGHTLALGLRAAEQHGLRDASTPYLQDIFARTREVAWISTVSDTELVVVNSAFGGNRAEEVRRARWPGVVRDGRFLSSAAGRLVLADRPELADRLRDRPLPALTRYTPTAWSRLRSLVDEVRDTNVAVESEESALGYACVAAGLRAPDGTLIGMVGVTGRTGGFDPARFRGHLLSAATAISGSLDAADPPPARIVPAGRGV
ncbi:IclR family transcriptional regulator C-terminal domain-containing protein [Actinoplanes sp. NPDC051851]|uniref:IclR family transcriptional regulator n=1 Tax=Actinoplanes sp. NPDC051851 TaxID=3154753 RepID=UPI00343C9339